MNFVCSKEQSKNSFDGLKKFETNTGASFFVSI